MAGLNVQVELSLVKFKEDVMAKVTYFVGDKNIPGWLKQQSNKGRVKFSYDENMNVIGGTLFSPSGSVVFGKGDVITLTNSGLSVKKAVTKNAKKNDYKGIQ